MTTAEADDILAQIDALGARLIEDDELFQLDPRYAVLAQWLDTDLDYISLERPE